MLQENCQIKCYFKCQIKIESATKHKQKIILCTFCNPFANFAHQMVPFQIVSFVIEMARIGGISLSFVFLLLFCESYGDFPSNFLGNYLSDEEYDNRTFCWTEVCMQDSGRLIYAADHNSNKTAPCDDFATFAMGEFYEHRVLNDRYPAIGFMMDVVQQHWEKQKKILLEPIKPNDPKMFKVIKSFFRQCINFSKRPCTKF